MVIFINKHLYNIINNQDLINKIGVEAFKQLVNNDQYILEQVNQYLQ